MQTSAIRACSYIAECSLSYAKIMQGVCNSKAGRQSLTRLDTVEPKLILCKDTQHVAVLQDVTLTEQSIFYETNAG